MQTQVVGGFTWKMHDWSETALRSLQKYGSKRNKLICWNGSERRIEA